MNIKSLKAPVISSLIVFSFAALFHFYNVSPNDWKGFFMWIPLYISPIWAITGGVEISNKFSRKKE